MIDIAVGDIIHVCGIGCVRITRTRIVPGPPVPASYGVPQPDIIYIDAVPSVRPVLIPGTPEALVDRMQNRRFAPTTKPRSSQRIDGSDT